MKERFVDLISLKLVIFVGLLVFATLNLIDPVSATGFGFGLALAMLGNWWSWENLQKLSESETTRRQGQQIALSGYLSNFILMLLAFGLGGFWGFNVFAIGGGLALAKLAFAGEELLRKVFVRA
jgi:hypothetical protein